LKKIKILRIIARLNIGGPAIHAILLTEGLDKQRFDSRLVCGSIDRDEGDMQYYASEKGISFYQIPELKRELDFFKDIAAFRKIYRFIKCEKPDIIHTHTAKAGCLGRVAGILYNIFPFPKNKKIILIHTFHGHIFSGYFNSLKSKLFVFIEQLLAVFTARIITVSESVKRELVSLHISKEEKIEVIPLGLELSKFLQIPAQAGGVLNIDIVGRLAPVKNHRLFLDAAALVVKDYPQARLRFRIIGDGKLRPELEKYSRQLKLQGQVDFLVWQRDLVEIYSGSGIVVLTSVNEGTPVSLIEAMASARAVVATGVGGVKDLLGKELESGVNPDADFKILERGLMVKPSDPYSFAKAVILLLQNNTLRKDMATRARIFVKDRFTKERLIKDIEDLYNQVLI
jgi:glycosyltransferase involved in cell wall biosynthesis